MRAPFAFWLTIACGIVAFVQCSSPSGDNTTDTSTGGGGSGGGATGAGGAAGSGGSTGTGGAGATGAGGATTTGAGGVTTTGAGGNVTTGAGGNVTTGSGGATGAGGAGGAGGGAGSSSGLPQPPGGGVAKPAGAVGGLSVLNWAGFKAAVSWTFDDSQPSQIAHYAELQAVGVPMTFYICDGNSGLAMFDATWTQAAKDGHEIGNHTAHHCQANLTGCSFGTALASQAAEIDTNTSYITSHYPQSGVWTMASPFGDTGWDTPAQASMFINRGVGAGTVGAGATDTTDAFNLPIHLAATGETAAMFNTQTDAAHTAGRWLIVLIHSITPTSASWYNPVAITDVTGAMSHGKSLTDVWTDTVVSIGAYWRAQKMFAGLTPVTSGGTTTWTWTLPAHFPPGKFLRVKVTGGTLTQRGVALAWNDHGYYEVALDAGSLALSP